MLKAIQQMHNMTLVVVDDEDRASNGDVVATTGGDYDVIPDELIVGVYGDYDITITADDVDRFHHLPCLAAG